MKKLLTLFLFFTIAFNTHAQNRYVDSLKTVLANTNDPAQQFGLLVKIGEDVFNGSSNFDSLTCIRLLRIAEQLKSDSMLATSYNWIGNYFRSNKGDNTTALEYFFKGIPLAEKAKDKRRLSSLYFDIALAYFNLYNPTDAAQYVRKGGASLPDKSSPMYSFMAKQYQMFMAMYFIMQHQPDSALHFVQALNEANLGQKNILFESMAQSQFGAVYDQLGEKELAEVYYKKGNALADSSRYYDVISSVKKSYIGFLLSNNKIPEAAEQGRQLLQLGRKLSNNDLKYAGAGFLRQVYDTLHRQDSAYYYARMELALSDTVFNQDNINKIEALAFNEQLRIIDEEAKIAAEEDTRKHNIQFALIALGIVVFVAVFLLLSRSIITNTKLIEFLGIMALLIVFEFLNLVLHPFLANVTGNRPLFMLLALVCLAALIAPLHHKVEEWATKILVEKNKQIRLEAARKTIEKLEREKNKGAV